MSRCAIYSIAFFPNQYETIPSVEYTDLSVATIIERVAPKDGPRIVTEKAVAPFFIPGALIVAPYIGRTAARFEAGAQGKQRSSAHVSASAWLPFDCDDISPEAKDTILGRLDGFVFCAYSTHSHGRDPDKVRMRVLLFLDRALTPSDWTAVWHVCNKMFFDGTADVATSRMSQCAGVWAAHPDRVSQSFRYLGKGAPLSADKLLALAPKPTPQKAKFIPRPSTPGALRARYEAALCWQDAGDYSVWLAGLASLRAAVEVCDMTEAEARDFWITWSATAPAARQARNGQAQYSPEAMFDRKPKLTTAADILVSALFGRARDAAERIVRAELPKKLSARAVRAETYLWRYHLAAFKKLRPAA